MNGWQAAGLPLHAPPRQLCVQAPQLPVSVVRSTHAPEQFVYPPAHPQLPFPSHTLFVPHDVPEAAFGVEHAPVPVLHVPARWHASSAGQDFGLPPRHVPSLWQVSVCVQAFPSVHVAPVATGLEHFPVVMSQVPAV
jgi:hypothetical protein